VTEATPQDDQLPAWARLTDVLVVALLLLALALVIGGRLRVSLGPVQLRIGSAERQILTALALAAIRHWRHPRPRIDQRLRRAWRRFWADPVRRGLTAHYFAIRIAILLVGYLATASFGLPERGPFRVSQNEFLNLPARWDSGWYLGIASGGYHYSSRGGQQNIAFMPGFPILMRIAGAFLGVDHDRLRYNLPGTDHARLLWAGVLVSLGLGWCGTLLLFRLAREWLDVDRAAGAALLLQTYPFALFYGAAYTEAFFLATSVGAILSATRRSWSVAFAWGLLAGISRPNGFVVSIPVGLIWLQHLWTVRTGGGSRAWQDRAGGLLATAAPILSMLAFSAIIYDMTGHPFRWAQLHAAWGREYRSVFSLASGYYERVLADGIYGYTSSAPIDALNLAAAMFALASIVPVWRRFGLPYAVFVLAIVLPPLTMGGVMSMGRISAPAFPAFLWLAASMSLSVQRTTTLAFMGLQGLAAALFFTWQPLN
jgi:hypothetical protein